MLKLRAGAKGEQAHQAATTRVVRARAKSNQNCRIALNLITLCLSAKPEMETSIIPVVTANTFISFEPVLACLSGDMTRWERQRASDRENERKRESERERERKS